jgi:hypothetical protein
VAAGIAMLLISVGMIAAGRGHVKLARRMRSFQTTRGRVVGREVAVVPGAGHEGRWGRGGRYRPKVTYEYTVGGVSYTSDRTSHVLRGLRESLVEQQLAAIPDEVDVHYDPASPGEAFLETHTPGLGRALMAGGAVGILLALVMILG